MLFLDSATNQEHWAFLSHEVLRHLSRKTKIKTGNKAGTFALTVVFSKLMATLRRYLAVPYACRALLALFGARN